MSFTKKLIVPLIFSLFFCFCCTNNKNHIVLHKKTFFKKVTYTTGLCFGSCPLTAGYIDDSLNFYFFGGRYSEKDSLPLGYFKCKIPDTIWYEINTKSENLKKYLDSSWEVNEDGWPIEINFTDTFNINRKISGEPNHMPDSIYFFVTFLQRLSRKIKLEKITDSVFFGETKILKERFRLPSSPPPPYLPIKKINFTPAKKKKR